MPADSTGQMISSTSDPLGQPVPQGPPPPPRQRRGRHRLNPASGGELLRQANEDLDYTVWRRDRHSVLASYDGLYDRVSRVRRPPELRRPGSSAPGGLRGG